MEIIPSMFQDARVGGVSGSLWRYVGAFCLVVFLQNPVAAEESLKPEIDPERGVAEASVGPLVTPVVAEPTKENKIPKFGHRLVLHPYDGPPSYLFLSFAEQKPTQVRALLTLDGALLVVPLKYYPNSKTHIGFFPTPSKTLNYQFQIITGEGKAMLSDVYSANPRCKSEAAESVAMRADKFEDQEKLIAEALDLDREIDRLDYVVNTLGEMLGE